MCNFSALWYFFCGIFEIFWDVKRGKRQFHDSAGPHNVLNTQNNGPKGTCNALNKREGLSNEMASATLDSQTSLVKVKQCCYTECTRKFSSTKRNKKDV